MPNRTGPAGRIAGLTPMLVATVAVVVAAIALTVAGVAPVLVIAMWICAAVVGGATIAVARRDRR